MRTYRYFISAAGSTTTDIKAPNAEAAHDIYESGAWKPDRHEWESYEVTEILCFDENGKQIEDDEIEV